MDKKKVEMKIEKVGEGEVKVSPKGKIKQNVEEFYKELDEKSVDDFLKELALKTLELWDTILKVSIKKNEIKDTRKINQFLVFAESADVTMAVMRTLKAQLVMHGTKLEKSFIERFGKSPNLVKAIHHCINIANAEDLKKLGDLMARQKKHMQSYVA